MSEGEIDAEMLAIEREIDKLQASINKSQLKPVVSNSIELRHTIFFIF